jgi:hypothetical protein
LADHFGENVLKDLEKNALKACDPNEANRVDLIWRKLQYRIPKNIKEVVEKTAESEDIPFLGVLRNVTLRNVHLYQEMTMGRKELKK